MISFTWSLTVPLNGFNNFREWSIKRRETKVSRRNEQFNRVLTEALPAIYEGPRDYSVRSPILDEGTVFIFYSILFSIQ